MRPIGQGKDIASPLLEDAFARQIAQDATQEILIRPAQPREIGGGLGPSDR